MDGHSRFVDIGTEKLHYLAWGSGKQLLLAFHGYGNNAGMFEPLLQYIGEAYTIFSFDLPHHGKSEWTPDTLLTPQHLKELVGKLMANHNVSKVSLLGFSMGARVCLSIVANMPKSISRLVLVAPDGLTVNSWYYLFTRTYFGKKAFRNIMERPKPYFRVLEWLRRRNFVDASRHKFVMYYLQSERSRNFLLRVWHGMSQLIPSPVKIRSVIKWYSIPVTIFMGAYDKVMPPALAKKFMSGLNTVQLIVLEKGHRVFDNETAQQIAQPFL
jgi:pimeloyl-ACP methyl ester carboxylesterase